MNSRNLIYLCTRLLLANGLIACSSGYKAPAASIKAESPTQESALARCVAQFQDNTPGFTVLPAVTGFDLGDTAEARGALLVDAKVDKVTYNRSYEDDKMISLDAHSFILEGDLTGSNYDQEIRITRDSIDHKPKLWHRIDVIFVKNGLGQTSLSHEYLVDVDNNCAEQLQYVTVATYDWGTATSNINASLKAADLSHNYVNSTSKTVPVENVKATVATQVEMMRDPLAFAANRVPLEADFVASGSIIKFKFEKAQDEEFYNPILGKTELMKSVITTITVSPDIEPQITKDLFSTTGVYSKTIPINGKHSNETISAELWRASKFAESIVTN